MTHEKYVSIKEIEDFLRLNEGHPLRLETTSFNKPKTGREIVLDTWKFREDTNNLYIGDFAVSIDHIANFYPITNWGSIMRIAMYDDEKNSINEIHLTTNLKDDNDRFLPFKQTNYIKELSKNKY